MLKSPLSYSRLVTYNSQTTPVIYSNMRLYQTEKNNNPPLVMSIRRTRVVSLTQSPAPASNVTHFCNLRQPDLDNLFASTFARSFYFTFEHRSGFFISYSWNILFNLHENIICSDSIPKLYKVHTNLQVLYCKSVRFN